MLVRSYKSVSGPDGHLHRLTGTVPPHWYLKTTGDRLCCLRFDFTSCHRGRGHV